MTGQEIIRLEGVTAGYPGKTVFQNVSLGIEARDYVGIIGPNGGGKTTLVRLLLGLIKPQRGTVSYLRGGKKVESVSMGYLPQYSEIDRKFPISVIDVVLSGLNNGAMRTGSYSKEQREQAMRVLSLLEIESLHDAHIGTLSGGQMQRALLGRAIVSKPEAIVLDEPNTYIDKRLLRQMFDLLAAVNKECAVILVSHDLQSVIDNARKVVLVNHGVIERPVGELTQADIADCFGIPLLSKG